MHYEKRSALIYPLSVYLTLSPSVALNVIVQFGLIISRFVDNSGGQNIVCLLLLLTPTLARLASNALECSDSDSDSDSDPDSVPYPEAIVMTFTCTTECY